jgi:hypothetical protein
MLTGLTVPVVDSLGFVGHDAQIVAWAGIAAIPLNMILHAISSSEPGPAAPPDSRVVVAASELAALPKNASPTDVQIAKAAVDRAVLNHVP